MEFGPGRAAVQRAVYAPFVAPAAEIGGGVEHIVVVGVQVEFPVVVIGGVFFGEGG